MVKIATGCYCACINVCLSALQRFANTKSDLFNTKHRQTFSAGKLQQQNENCKMRNTCVAETVKL